MNTNILRFIMLIVLNVCTVQDKGYNFLTSNFILFLNSIEQFFLM